MGKSCQTLIVTRLLFLANLLAFSLWAIILPHKHAFNALLKHILAFFNLAWRQPTGAFKAPNCTPLKHCKCKAVSISLICFQIRQKAQKYQRVFRVFLTQYESKSSNRNRARAIVLLPRAKRLQYRRNYHKNFFARGASQFLLAYFYWDKAKR